MNKIFSMVSAAQNVLKNKEVTIIIEGSRRQQISKRAKKIKEVKTMKKGSRVTKMLVVVLILIISLTSTAAAEERFDSKTLESKIRESMTLDSKTFEVKTFDIQDPEKAKEIGNQIVDQIKEKTEEYTQSSFSQKYSKSDDQVLGKIKIRYEDVSGNLLKSDVKVGLDLGNHTVTAIPIEGFKLVSKGSFTVALTEEKHEWLIVFKYQKTDKEEPTNPVDPTDPENPVDPKDPDKEEVKQPEKPKTVNPKETNSNNKEKVVKAQAKLPKTGSARAALYLVGGLVSLSGGMILRKKK